tara:strand:- start:63 stop:182 length:120 start_codon:yes stop_codon:yes gene_type:complete
LQLEKYDDALSSYEKAIEVSPGYADAETCFAKVKELEGE